MDSNIYQYFINIIHKNKELSIFDHIEVCHNITYNQLKLLFESNKILDRIITNII